MAIKKSAKSIDIDTLAELANGGKTEEYSSFLETFDTLAFGKYTFKNVLHFNVDKRHCNLKEDEFFSGVDYVDEDGKTVIAHEDGLKDIYSFKWNKTEKYYFCTFKTATDMNICVKMLNEHYGKFFNWKTAKAEETAKETKAKTTKAKTAKEEETKVVKAKTTKAKTAKVEETKVVKAKTAKETKAKTTKAKTAKDLETVCKEDAKTTEKSVVKYDGSAKDIEIALREEFRDNVKGYDWAEMFTNLGISMKRLNELFADINAKVETLAKANKELAKELKAVKASLAK